MKKITVALFLLVANTIIAHAQNVVINEVMQSNIDYLMVDKDFPDSWVELYNPSSSQVNLSGYRLGEKNNYEKAYKLPSNTTISPNGYLLIYCDKENRGLHTDFRVDAGNASLFLFDNKGTAVDSLFMKEMPASNIAYGRTTDGAGEWQYEVTPTAGAANGGVFTDVLLPEPVFSVKGGIVGDEASILSVKIGIPEGVELPADTRLYITNDGSEPTLSSRSFPESFTFNLTATTVVRAKLMSSQALSRRSTTQSYIFHPRAADIPVVSIVTNRDYIYSSEIGITSGAVNDGKPNYMQSWRRPLNIEYFNLANDGKYNFNQLCETAISGVSTREQPQKSMKMYANKRFEKKNFKGVFWDQKPTVKKVKSFVLRSGGNNSFTTRINDAAIQSLFGDYCDDVDYQAYQPVIVYINGSYAGEFGMRERSNEDFVEANYGIEDIEMADEASYQRPAAGTLFDNFFKSYRNPSTTYAELAEQMDMDNFTATLVAEVYAMNTDFPTNNVSMWRPTEEGGKWRWILKDLDRAGMNIAMYPSTFDMFQYLFNPDDLMFSGMNHFDLYKRMVSFPEFNDRFIDMMMVSLGDYLRGDVMAVRLDSMKEQIYSELKPTFYAYNCISEWSKFNANFNNLKKFFNERPQNIYSQMAAWYNLGKVIPVTVANTTGKVTINGIPLRTSAFDGSCFANRLLIIDTGSGSLGWQITVTHRDGTIQTEELMPGHDLMLSDYMYDENDKISVSFTMIEMPVEPEEETAITSTPTPDTYPHDYTLQGILKTGTNSRGVIISGGKKVLKR